MKVYLGIDLGSTTSKAVFLDEEGRIIGRGITNTRANYEVAAEIARMEAEFNSRFSLLNRQLQAAPAGAADWKTVLPALENRFHYLQFRSRFQVLQAAMLKGLERIEDPELRARVRQRLESVSTRAEEEIRSRFFDGQVATRTEFFRDLVSSVYLSSLDGTDRQVYEQLLALYDRSITPVENQLIREDFIRLTGEALDLLPGELDFPRTLVESRLQQIADISLEPEDYIGTGYGRQLLPFAREHIKSEILCHARGAHATFPATRTVLDIGGQDTKAIQVDAQGYVTSFQMNDRCAAGCGRYLGYIADEMNVSVSELGPLADAAEYETNICSTCTVFAGAELREYLNLGEKKENILAGLHQAIVQRAFALLARSGGVRNEFTFTGGVARNSAVVRYVGRMITAHYGDITINLHSDSIFMGALGAALFSRRK